MIGVRKEVGQDQAGLNRAGSAYAMQWDAYPDHCVVCWSFPSGYLNVDCPEKLPTFRNTSRADSETRLFHPLTYNLPVYASMISVRVENIALVGLDFDLADQTHFSVS